MIPRFSRRRFIFGRDQTPKLEPVPRARTQVALVAQIQVFDCLSQRGQVCSVCQERCPTPGAVLIEGTRVRIAEQTCTGCGSCQSVCPAPQNAIVLWPRPPAALTPVKAGSRR